MTLRQQLEAAIDDGIDAGAVVDYAIALLDTIDGDPDFEDIDREPDIGEDGDLPPLMDGGFGYGLGRLPIYDQCPCCGHRILECYVQPVLKGWLGDDAKVW
jgi:hypothetical protein